VNLPSSTIPSALRATFAAVRRLPLVVLGLALVACVCASSPAVETPARVTVGPPEVRVAVRTRTTDRISGTYVGDWGQLELALDADGVTVHGAYGDAAATAGAEPVGTFVGDLRDGILRGRWCQGPVRSRPPANSLTEASRETAGPLQQWDAAGDADFRLKSDTEKTTLDGRWRSDVTGTDDRDDDEGWREDWDVTRIAGPAGPFAAAAARAHCP
jgi:hypothetical protein